MEIFDIEKLDKPVLKNDLDIIGKKIYIELNFEYFYPSDYYLKLGFS